MKGTWQTTGSGSGAATAALVIGAAVLAASIAGPVVAAVAELARLVVIAVAVLGGLALLGGAVSVAYRLRQRRATPARVVSVVPSTVVRPSRALPAPRPELERHPEVHLHLHGMTAEDVAAILRQHGTGRGPGTPPDTGED